MTDTRSETDSLRNISEHVPFLRRYGRALAGNQLQGDGMAAATLSTVLASPDILPEGSDPKVALFTVFQRLWSQTPSERDQVDSDPLARSAQKHLAALEQAARNALLLKGLEQFSTEDVAQILQTSVGKVQGLLAAAYEGMADTVSGRILIIEDDCFIANELESIVTGLGHVVTGNAATKSAATTLAMEEEPDLILADVVLADQTSGIDAIAEIHGAYNHKKPVVYITGHPEQLLTGQTEEPAFLIPKPYMHEQVRTAVNQALFFADR